VLQCRVSPFIRGAPLVPAQLTPLLAALESHDVPGREQAIDYVLGLLIDRPTATAYDVLSQPSVEASTIECLLNFYLRHANIDNDDRFNRVEQFCTLTNASSPWFPRSSRVQLRVVAYILNNIKSNTWPTTHRIFSHYLHWAHAVLS